MLLLAAALAVPRGLPAYAVLTHEAIIDSAWDGHIKPLLLASYPASDAHALLEAHAYAYAGCIIQDMGYYPFGSRLFTDLAHYARTGEFVENLLREAQNVDEYAFALGALAHYAADTQGHPTAVNASVPIQFPKLARHFGHTVTYEQNPLAHVRVEFGFDVLQVARGHYAPQEYHDFIGFLVAKDVLARAFHDTYSIELGDLFDDLDLALSTYRHAVSSVIPEMTRVAWSLKREDLKRMSPGVTKQRFIYNISQSSYRGEWSQRYRKPGFEASFFATIIRILPKVGPLRALAVKLPTAQTEALFESSFDRALAEYRRLLTAQGQKSLHLANLDLDTGAPVRPADYWMADNAYAQLAIKLAAKDPSEVDPKVTDSVLQYFSDTSLPFNAKIRDRDDWRRTMAAIDKLKMRTIPANSAAGREN